MLQNVVPLPQVFVDKSVGSALLDPGVALHGAQPGTMQHTDITLDFPVCCVQRYDTSVTC